MRHRGTITKFRSQSVSQSVSFPLFHSKAYGPQWNNAWNDSSRCLETYPNPSSSSPSSFSPVTQHAFFTRLPLATWRPVVTVPPAETARTPTFFPPTVFIYFLWLSARHVARVRAGRGAYRILAAKSEGRSPLVRPGRRWEDNIKIGF